MLGGFNDSERVTLLLAGVNANLLANLLDRQGPLVENCAVFPSFLLTRLRANNGCKTLGLTTSTASSVSPSRDRNN